MPKSIIILTLSILFSIVFVPVLAQTGDMVTASATDADNYFSDEDFDDALEAYLTLVDKYPDNDLYNYRLGVCYLNTNIDKTKAIPYLELVAHLKKHNPNTLYLLGRAYQFAYRFDDAIKTFNDFKEEGKGSPDNMKDAEVQIQYCMNAKELMKFPVNITFENLGKNINSPYDDYYPFVPTNESFIVFNSKRGGAGKQKVSANNFSPSIYISYVSDGQYQPAVNIGPPIDAAGKSSEVVGLSKEGDYMLFYYFDKKGFGSIFSSTDDGGKSFSTPMALPEVINQKNQHQIAASITADGSTIYFASDRPGGLGGIDIYVSKKLPNGGWGVPQNLGPVINTPSNEDFPNISPDGKTLYFSSQGHTGMGGYDIFKANWSDSANQWSSVQNMGYPINTPDDDMNFRIAANGSYGYISQVRKGGYGGLDVYRIKFNNAEQLYSVVIGLVQSADTSAKIKNFSDIMISISDAKTNELYGNYVPNGTTGRYVMILPPGKYHVSIITDGFTEYKKDLNIEDKGSFKTEINQDIYLTHIPK
ncbi:MAG: hypothetical protein ACLQQ4_04320 [Bacteroidia bacterium]